MRFVTALIAAFMMLSSVAFAQQISREQRCRQIGAVLADENQMLGAEKDQLASQLDAARAQIATLTKQLTDEKEKNKPSR